MRCFARLDRCWSAALPTHQVTRARVDTVEGEPAHFVLEHPRRAEHAPAALASATPAKGKRVELGVSPAGRSAAPPGTPAVAAAPARSGRRAALRARLGLSLGGGWVVTSGMLCIAVLYAACATGLLDARGPVVQRILALCTLALALCLTPHSGIGFRAKAARAIAPVLPRPLRLKFLDGSTLMLHQPPPNGIRSPRRLERELGGSPASTDERSPRRPGLQRVTSAAQIHMASAAEKATIAEVMLSLKAKPPPILPAPEVLEVQLLRFVREHGRKASTIEKKFRAACAWKAENLSSPIMQVLLVIHI